MSIARFAAINQEKKPNLWRAGCCTTQGGCEAEAIAKTRDEAIKAWNTRVWNNTTEIKDEVEGVFEAEDDGFTTKQIAAFMVVAGLVISCLAILGGLH